MGEENLEQLDELQEETTQEAQEASQELSGKATINSPRVVEALGLEDAQVEIVEEISEVEVKVKQGKNEFVIGRESLEVSDE